MTSSSITSARCPEAAAAAQVRAFEGRRMIVSPAGHDMPILDAAVLDELEDELADHELMRRFAADYAARWKHRLDRLAAAIEDKDRETALDAAISVKVSSAMIGGVRLARISEVLEQAIREDVLDNSQTALASMAEAGSATVKEIEVRYSLMSG